jgi:hypothetical protein
MRFVRRQAGRVVPLYLLNGALLIAVIAAYAPIAPGASGSGWAMWAGFVLSQLFLAARLWTRIVFWASEAALVGSSVRRVGRDDALDAVRVQRFDDQQFLGHRAH